MTLFKAFGHDATVEVTCEGGDHYKVMAEVFDSDPPMTTYYHFCKDRHELQTVLGKYLTPIEHCDLAAPWKP